MLGSLVARNSSREGSDRLAATQLNASSSHIESVVPRTKVNTNTNALAPTGATSSNRCRPDPITRAQ